MVNVKITTRRVFVRDGFGVGFINIGPADVMMMLTARMLVHEVHTNGVTYDFVMTYYDGGSLQMSYAVDGGLPLDGEDINGVTILMAATENTVTDMHVRDVTGDQTLLNILIARAM